MKAGLRLSPIHLSKHLLPQEILQQSDLFGIHLWWLDVLLLSFCYHQGEAEWIFPSKRHGMIQPDSEVCVQSCCVIVVMTSVVVLWPRERGLCSRKDRCWWSCRIRYQTHVSHVNVCLESVSHSFSSVKHLQAFTTYAYIASKGNICQHIDYFSAKLVFWGVIPMQTAPWTAMLEIWYVASAELGEWSGMRLKTWHHETRGGWVQNFSWSIFCVGWVWGGTAVDVRFTLVMDVLCI